MALIFIVHIFKQKMNLSKTTYLQYLCMLLKMDDLVLFPSWECGVGGGALSPEWQYNTLRHLLIPSVAF